MKIVGTRAVHGTGNSKADIFSTHLGRVNGAHEHGSKSGIIAGVWVVPLKCVDEHGSGKSAPENF